MHDDYSFSTGLPPSLSLQRCIFPSSVSFVLFLLLSDSTTDTLSSSRSPLSYPPARLKFIARNGAIPPYRRSHTIRNAKKRAINLSGFDWNCHIQQNGIFVVRYIFLTGFSDGFQIGREIYALTYTNGACRTLLYTIQQQPKHATKTASTKNNNNISNNEASSLPIRCVRWRLSFPNK